MEQSIFHRISLSSQDRNQRKVNYEDRTKSILTDGNCESAMEKAIALLWVRWNVFHCTLGKWNFLFNNTWPIKRPEFNEVLYKDDMCSFNLCFVISRTVLCFVISRTVTFWLALMQSSLIWLKKLRFSSMFTPSNVICFVFLIIWSHILTTSSLLDLSTSLGLMVSAWSFSGLVEGASKLSVLSLEGYVWRSHRSLL